jgi:hypothetical protein
LRQAIAAFHADLFPLRLRMPPRVDQWAVGYVDHIEQ